MTDPTIADRRRDARHAEINRRYAWQHRRNGAKRTRPSLATLRLSELDRIATTRYVSIPDDDNGRALIQAYVDHAWSFVDADLRVAVWLRLRAPWLDHPPPVSRRRWTADALAKFIELTMADRTRLRICTIGAMDCDKTHRKALRAAKARERSRRNRTKRQIRRKRSESLSGEGPLANHETC